MHKNLILKISKIEDPKSGTNYKFLVETLLDSFEIQKDDLEPLINDSGLAKETLLGFYKNKNLKIFEKIEDEDLTFIGDLKKINEFKHYMMKEAYNQEERSIEHKGDVKKSPILKAKFNKKSPIFFYSLLDKNTNNYLYLMFPYSKGPSFTQE